MSNTNPQIPQNPDTLFYFSKNSLFRSVDVYIKWDESVDLENLFLIFKSYTEIEENLIKSVYVIGHSEDLKKTPIFHSISLKKISKITYIDFDSIYYDYFEHDYEYLKSLNYYGFRFVFLNESLNWRSGHIYPIFPWNEDFKSMYLKKYRMDRTLKAEVSILKQKISNLKREKVILLKRLRRVGKNYTLYRWRKN